MIRSRLVDALRRQEWAAVLIELVTVVLGLFLGLQLNDWNEARQSHAREKAALERLQEESETIVAYFRDSVEKFDEVNAAQEAAIGALSTGDRAKFDTHRLARLIGSLAFYPGIAPPRAAYDELSSSGLLNEIGSTPVREAIARYYAKLAWIQSQLEYFRAGTIQNFSSPPVGQVTTYDPNAPQLMDRFVYSADFDVIAADRAYMTLLVGGLRDQVVFQRYRRDLNAEAETMCETLASALHKPCNAAAPSVPHAEPAAH